MVLTIPSDLQVNWHKSLRSSSGTLKKWTLNFQVFKNFLLLVLYKPSFPYSARVTSPNFENTGGQILLSFNLTQIERVKSPQRPDLVFVTFSVLFGEVCSEPRTCDHKPMKARSHSHWDFLSLKDTNTLKTVMWWNYDSYLQFQRNCLLVSGTLRTSPRGNMFSLSEDIQWANIYKVSHCLLKLNSSKTNPRVMDVVSLLCSSREPSEGETPHSLPSALCFQFIHTVTRNLYSGNYTPLLSYLQQTWGNGTAYQSARPWLHPPLWHATALRHVRPYGTTVPVGNQVAGRKMNSPLGQEASSAFLGVVSR